MQPIHYTSKGFKELSNLIVSKNYSKLFVLVDSNTIDACLPYFLSNLATKAPFEIVEIEPGEENKNIETCTMLWEVLTELEADRNALILLLGGGVLTDLGAFVASTFKRGIDFVTIPTTLLAMIDASVGGKTGVDLGVLKNQIGLFSLPEMVLIDTEFLNTLEANQLRAGLAEVIKHGLIADADYFEKIENLKSLTEDDLLELVEKSVVIKQSIVNQDPTEKGFRKILNFGHTLGHAIESYCLKNENKTTLLHGEAVAIGMFLESHISMQLNLISNESFNRIKNCLDQYFTRVAFTKSDIENLLLYLVHDKKNNNGAVNFTLLNNIGSSVWNKEVSNSLILSAFEKYIEN